MLTPKTHDTHGINQCGHLDFSSARLNRRDESLAGFEAFGTARGMEWWSLSRGRMRDPSNARDWIELARLHHAQRDLIRAVDALQNSLRIEPSNSNVWEMAADAYHELSETNWSYASWAIISVRHALRLRPDSASSWTNVAKVLGESGRHDEAVDATTRALHLDGSFHTRYQHAEALTSGKRRAEAQVVYRELLQRADAPTQPTLADVHNHLAVSLLESESYHIDGRSAAFDGLEGRESELCRGGHDTSGVVLRGLTTPCDAVSDALAASRAALRLRPACRYAHAQNYYQVLATSDDL